MSKPQHHYSHKDLFNFTALWVLVLVMLLPTLSSLAQINEKSGSYNLTAWVEEKEHRESESENSPLNSAEYIIEGQPALPPYPAILKAYPRHRENLPLHLYYCKEIPPPELPHSRF